MIPGKEYTPEVILQIAWRRKWLILLPAIAIASAAAVWTHRLVDEYRADTLIQIVPQKVPENYVKSTVTQTIDSRLQSISQQILSRTQLERIIDDLNLYANRRKTAIMEDLVEEMRGNIETPIMKGDTFRLSFTDTDARTAMKVTERLASLFIDESLRDRETLAEGTAQFLEAQLEDVRRQLVDNEKKLEDYRRTHDGQLPSQLAANMQGMHNNELQLQQIVDMLNRARDRHLVLERQIADADISDALASSATTTPPTKEGAPQTAADQLRAAQATLASMELRLRPEHPDVIHQRRTIEDLQKKVDEEAAAQPVSAGPAGNPVELVRRNRLQDLHTELDNLDKQVDALTTEEKRLRGVIGEYQKRIEAEPTRESELTDLMRDYSTLQASYTALLAKKQESQISANLERRQIGEQFRILDAVRLPTKPATPNRPRFYGLGVLVGIAVGLALAALVEYFDRTMRNEEDIRAALQLPVLATIPVVRTRRRRRRAEVVSASAAAALIMLVSAFVRTWTSR